jgi:hypothetical protein
LEQRKVLEKEAFMRWAVIVDSLYIQILADKEAQ